MSNAQETLTIISLNGKKYHIKHKENTVVFAIDYNSDCVVGNSIDLQIIYNSTVGIYLKEIKGTCVSELERGVKKVASVFKRRQNYSRCTGSRKNWTYIQANLGDK